MKRCAKCASADVVFVLVKKDGKYLNVQWICTEHLLQLFQRLNKLFPRVDYEAKIRKA